MRSVFASVGVFTILLALLLAPLVPLSEVAKGSPVLYNKRNASTMVFRTNAKMSTLESISVVQELVHHHAQFSDTETRDYFEHHCYGKKIQLVGVIQSGSIYPTLALQCPLERSEKMIHVNLTLGSESGGNALYLGHGAPVQVEGILANYSQNEWGQLILEMRNGRLL